jgi:hypothetical protein
MNAAEAMNKLAALAIGLAAILLLGIVARDVLDHMNAPPVEEPYIFTLPATIPTCLHYYVASNEHFEGWDIDQPMTVESYNTHDISVVHNILRHSWGCGFEGKPQ